MGNSVTPCDHGQECRESTDIRSLPLFLSFYSQMADGSPHHTCGETHVESSVCCLLLCGHVLCERVHLYLYILHMYVSCSLMASSLFSVVVGVMAALCVGGSVCVGQCLIIVGERSEVKGHHEGC